MERRLCARQVRCSTKGNTTIHLPMNPQEGNLVSKHQTRQRLMKLILLLASITLSAAVFLTLDWFRSAAIRRSSASSGKVKNCGVRDPVRHHALKPNCTSVYRWGGDSYEFATNNLGFRDQRAREVELTDARPRILLLGDSFTEGKIAWRDSYVGRIADHFPQYDFLNGGVSSYSPSNYLNVARMVFAARVDIDEVMVFIDISDVQDEASFYRDTGASGAVTGPQQDVYTIPWWARTRGHIAGRFMLTSYFLRWLERRLVGYGYYHLTTGPLGDAFDMERAAWTYRKVDETDSYYGGYAPLGVEAGIAKEKAKMTLLWQELAKRNIPISVVVYPYPAQIVHDTADSRQVRIWGDWCEGKCKRFISLFPAFLAVKDRCPRSRPGCWYQKLFVFGDTHYNIAGNTLVADAVIRSLGEMPPIKRQQETTGRESSKTGRTRESVYKQQPADQQLSN